MYGIDLSNHQRDLDLSKLDFDFAIIKATEGIDYKDLYFNRFAVQLTGMDKLIGCYHFARPDNRKSPEDMVNEAKWFLQVVKEAGLLGKAILCLDYETPPYDPQMAKIWLNYVATHSNATPFIYGSTNVLQKFITAGILKSYKIWMAKWPSIEKFLVGVNPGLTLPSKAMIPYDIWQYTSNGYAVGYNGKIDLDYSSLTSDAWMLLADKMNAKVEELSPDMKWAIEMGLFKGYPDGSYKPFDPVTRSALATVLRRFYKNVLNTAYGNYASTIYGNYVDTDSVVKKEDS